MPQVELHDWGTVPYLQAWTQQQEIFDAIVAAKIRQRDKADEIIPANQLIYVEHPHVFTLGKSGKPEHLLLSESMLKAQGIDYYPINRGGDITYHGPGSLVGYPIWNLDDFFTDIHKYLRYLEEVVIRTLAHYHIVAGRSAGETGVWLDADDKQKARKICAFGVRCSRWVTMHGFSLNVNTDLSYFNKIVPCGIVDKGVTSIQQELGREIPMEEVKLLVKKHMAELFEIQWILNNSIKQ